MVEIYLLSPPPLLTAREREGESMYVCVGTHESINYVLIMHFNRRTNIYNIHFIRKCTRSM